MNTFLNKWNQIQVLNTPYIVDDHHFLIGKVSILGNILPITSSDLPEILRLKLVRKNV